MRYDPLGVAVRNERGNKATPLDERSVIFQDLDNGAQMTIWERATNVHTVIDVHGCQILRAGNGEAAWFEAGKLKSTFGLERDGDIPLDFEPGMWTLYVTAYVSDKGIIRAIDTETFDESVFTADSGGILDEATSGPCFSALPMGHAAWLDASGALRCTMPGFAPCAQRASYMRAVPACDSVYFVLSVGTDLKVRPFDSDECWQVPTGFVPDLCEDRGLLKLGWTVGADELPGELRELHINPDSARKPFTEPVTVPTFAPTRVPCYSLGSLPGTYFFRTVGNDAASSAGLVTGFGLGRLINRCLGGAHPAPLTIYRDGQPWDDVAEREAQQAIAAGVPVQRLDGSGYGSPTKTPQSIAEAYLEHFRPDVLPILAGYRHADWLGSEQEHIDLIADIRRLSNFAGIPCVTFGEDRTIQTTPAIVATIQAMRAAVHDPLPWVAPTLPAKPPAKPPVHLPDPPPVLPPTHEDAMPLTPFRIRHRPGLFWTTDVDANGRPTRLGAPANDGDGKFQVFYAQMVRTPQTPAGPLKFDVGATVELDLFNFPNNPLSVADATQPGPTSSAIRRVTRYTVRRSANGDGWRFETEPGLSLRPLAGQVGAGISLALTDAAAADVVLEGLDGKELTAPF